MVSRQFKRGDRVADYLGNRAGVIEEMVTCAYVREPYSCKGDWIPLSRLERVPLRQLEAESREAVRASLLTQWQTQTEPLG